MAYQASERDVAAGLTACRECDLVQREPVCATACAVKCRRCGALLYHDITRGLDAVLALTLAAAILFVLANFLPVMSLQVQGRDVSTTLLGLTSALYDAGRPAVAALVLATLLLMPALQILMRVCLLLPLRLGGRPPHMALVTRVLATARAWGMVEVFFLAAVVCIHRLDQIGRLELEPAFWAIGGVMLLLTATDTVFDPRAPWARLARGLA